MARNLVGVSTKKVWPSPRGDHGPLFCLLTAHSPIQKQTHTHVPWALPWLEDDRVCSQRRPSSQQSLIQAILTQCP